MCAAMLGHCGTFLFFVMAALIPQGRPGTLSLRHTPGSNLAGGTQCAVCEAGQSAHELIIQAPSEPAVSSHAEPGAA